MGGGRFGEGWGWKRGRVGERGREKGGGRRMHRGVGKREGGRDGERGGGERGGDNWEEWRREPGRGMGKRKESRRKRGGWRSEGKERQSSRPLLWLVLSLVQAARGTSPLLITA